MAPLLFNSWTFAALAVLVYPAYYLLRLRAQNWLLLIASYAFYGSWDVRFLGLLWLSTVVDYWAAVRIDATDDPRWRRRWLVASVICNLTILGFFKYFNFFVDSAAVALRAAGIEAQPLHLSIVLPIGISFYTFQTMSYTIDVYRRRLRARRDLLVVALYVAFFPQLVAGPIERAEHLLPQFETPRTLDRGRVVCGGWLLLWGLFLKCVVADNLGLVADRAFMAPVAPAGAECLFAIYAFAYQIFCDFWGYSTMASGLAALLGVELMTNFNHPYISRSPREFWRRWHISLSIWLRDYLYIPLGGGRHGVARARLNLMITMLLGGLWHGAAWNFIAWGGYQGGLLVADHWTTGIRRRIFPERVRAALGVLLTFQAMAVGWLLFRASSMEQVRQFLVRIISDVPAAPLPTAVTLVPVAAMVGLLWAFQLWTGGQDDPRRFPGWNNGLAGVPLALLVLLVVTLSPSGGRPFLYFQF